MAVSFTRNRPTAAALAVAGAALLAFATTGSAPAQELAPITFTQAQANAGAQVYASACVGCHGAELQGIGGPRLAGAGAGILSRTVGAVFAYISQNMPRDDPGALSAAQYLNLIAFIARSNGFTAGPTPLPADPQLLNGIAFRQ